MTLREYLKSIADKFREVLYSDEPINAKDFTSMIELVFHYAHDDGYLMGFPAGEEQGIEYGKEQGKQEFWDVVLQEGNRTNYGYAFAYWGNIDFRPTYPIRPTNAGYMFMGSKISSIPDGVSLDFSNSTAMNYVFSNASTTEIYSDISTVSASDLSALFGWNSNIRYIHRIILKDDGSQKLSYMFDNCYALEQVSFSGKFGQNISFAQSTKLSHDSLLSIIDALYDYSASGTTRTLTIGSGNKAKLTEAELLVAENKGWTVA